jgi:two-component system cell cycle sensor histidine kinase/response regulator CckA
MANHPKMSLEGLIERWLAAQAGSHKSQSLEDDEKSEGPVGDLQVQSVELQAQMILLVDDEDIIRDLVREILRARGYTVLEARHGGEAMLLSEHHKGPIHLMVSELEMPLISGRDLAKRLRPLRPEMRVLYMSGSAADGLFRPSMLEVGSAFLQKPFTPEALEIKVRSLLD